MPDIILKQSLRKYRLNCWQQLSDSNSINHINEILTVLFQIERYWAYPGFQVLEQLAHYQANTQTDLFQQLAKNTCTSLTNNDFRQQAFTPFSTNLTQLDTPKLSQSLTAHRDQENQLSTSQTATNRIYIEVLILHPDKESYQELYHSSLSWRKQLTDEFLYDIIIVSTIEDAIIALLSNPAIELCVHLFGVPMSSNCQLPQAREMLNYASLNADTENATLDLISAKNKLAELRPELAHFFISEAEAFEIEPIIHTSFDRVISGANIFQTLHYHILSNIRERYTTPFFNALRSYSSKTKSPFHALPLSQGASINNSHWIKDLLDFYGKTLFDAETSSAQGGLDSLLDPVGAIQQANEKVAKTFQSDRSVFVTNGTSTSNKIVMQANLCPGDLILVSSDCHKSIPYAIMLSGAIPVFIETYPLDKYDLHGAVSLQRIKTVLLELKKIDQLDKVKQITLTNTTFDGVIYNVENFMWEILSIKPDIIFHWDEAWFAYAGFHPVYRNKTAMRVARKIRKKLNQPEYQEQFRKWDDKTSANKKDTPSTPLNPDPTKVKLRVYVTQSTHKTLSALRQGSMLHVQDEQFDEGTFAEAFYMHTTTSPNYQIIASLDIARRQADLEGFEHVDQSIEYANLLRQSIQENDKLNRCFKVLSDQELIPKQYRYKKNTQDTVRDVWQQWQNSEFVVDPTRITLDIRTTGLTGNQFRELLINQFAVQVNKTSRHTVLFIINIGITLANIQYLLDVLHQIAGKLQQRSLKEIPIINLPLQRQYHKKYRRVEGKTIQGGDIRQAYYDSMKEENITYIELTNDLLKQVLNDRQIIAAGFVTPYPPGFPILVPGQIISYDLLIYLQKSQIKEIHGYHAEKGLKILSETCLN